MTPLILVDFGNVCEIADLAIDLSAGLQIIGVWMRGTHHENLDEVRSMKPTDKDLASYVTKYPGVEIRTYDADADTTVDGTYIQPLRVVGGQTVRADDGSYWVADRAATGHRLARRVRERTRRGELMRPSDTQLQSCAVRPATADEIAAYEAAEGAANAAEQVDTQQAMAADDYRARTDQ